MTNYKFQNLCLQVHFKILPSCKVTYGLFLLSNLSIYTYCQICFVDVLNLMGSLLSAICFQILPQITHQKRLCFGKKGFRVLKPQGFYKMMLRSLLLNLFSYCSSSPRQVSFCSFLWKPSRYFRTDFRDWFTNYTINTKLL